jgi:dolichol-phosphate mannosyltransferase
MATDDVMGEKGFFGQRALWTFIALAVLLRLIFIFLLDLFPEEAYYWSYAQHLDIGYLDHPPMIAWTIWAFTTVFGNHEFAVRLPAILSWFLMAYFMYRFTVNLVGQRAAALVVAMLAVLPIYIAVGFMATPDAPLYAFWAGGLYFLERALVAGKKNSWWGAGVCVGLGFLSKYTMGLVPAAIVVYMLLDKRARRWFVRPEPYLAGILALVIMSPVFYWNYMHDWISFAFQGTRRWSGEINFNLHTLIGSALILITPVGLVEAIRVMIRPPRVTAGDEESNHEGAARKRSRLFVLIFALVPLSVFVIHSLRNQPKLNWTGPVWLPVLPWMAAVALQVTDASWSWWRRHLRAIWAVTLVVIFILLAVGLTYTVIGLPGAGASHGMPLPTAWQEFGEKIKEIETQINAKSGTTPMVVGMDKYWIASELNFYDHFGMQAPPEVGGSALLGDNSLMWNYWVPPSAAVGQNLLMVSFNRGRLEGSGLNDHFSHLDEVYEANVKIGQRVVSKFFWRLGYNYRR